MDLFLFIVGMFLACWNAYLLPFSFKSGNIGVIVMNFIGMIASLFVVFTYVFK